MNNKKKPKMKVLFSFFASKAWSLHAVVITSVILGVFKAGGIAWTPQNLVLASLLAMLDTSSLLPKLIFAYFLAALLRMPLVPKSIVVVLATLIADQVTTKMTTTLFDAFPLLRGLSTAAIVVWILYFAYYFIRHHKGGE